MCFHMWRAQVGSSEEREALPCIEACRRLHISQRPREWKTGSKHPDLNYAESSGESNLPETAQEKNGGLSFARMHVAFILLF